MSSTIGTTSKTEQEKLHWIKIQKYIKTTKYVPDKTETIISDFNKK